MSAMMEALATVEASAIRRNLFLGDLDREVVVGRMADLLAAKPLPPGNDDADEDELSGGGCATDLLPSTRRIGLSRTGLEAEPPAGAGGNESNGRAVLSLLTLLERRTSRVYNDECLGGPIDLSSGLLDPHGQHHHRPSRTAAVTLDRFGGASSSRGAE